MDFARVSSVLLISFVLMFLFVHTSSAQLGEEAGTLAFQVPIGSSQTIQWHLANEGNSSLNIYIYVPSLQNVSNEVTPTIIASPMNFTIPPYSRFIVNITATMPANDQPNVGGWSGMLQAVETSNASAPGGAVILAGVGKKFTIFSAPPTTTTTSIPPASTTSNTQQPTVPTVSGNLAAIGIVVIVVVVIAILGLLYVMEKNKRAKAKKKRTAARGKRRRATPQRSSARNRRARSRRTSARQRRRR
ncbi:MAG: hypothetical protein M1504_00585 [Candidatus Marsarchaeota archaeon]|nr:hypothetical protein [Candidatus Marsarchaeota archaeon]